MNRLMMLMFVAALGAGGLTAATDITSDITSDTTWTSAGSPYRLKPVVGDIKVKSGAILTIDSTSGAVDVEWVGSVATDFDLSVGDPGGLSPTEGSLVINAASGAITFKVKTGGNIRIKSNGQLRWTDTTASTTFTRYDGSNTWGALIFEASQTRQSEVKKSTFSYGGNDSQTAMVVVNDMSSNYPSFADIAFSNQATSGVAAIRCNTKGVNILKEGNFTSLTTGGNVMSVSSIDYVFYLNAVTSTETATIRFPDVDSPDSPTAYLTGTCQVGDSSNVSHWRFDDGYTFKCAASSKLQIVNGSVWGTVESRPTFEANTGTSTTHWTGIVDDSTTKPNVFGTLGPMAFVTVRNASVGFDINKGTSYVPESEQKTLWRFPGLTAKKCDTGLRVRSFIDTSHGDAGYTTVVEGADLGDPGSTDECGTACVNLQCGRVVLDSCRIKGAGTRGIGIGTLDLTTTYDIAIRDCLITDSAATSGVLVDSSQGAGAVDIRRTVIAGYATAIEFFQTSSGGYTPARSLAVSHSFITATSSGATAKGLSVDIRTGAVCAIQIDDCTISGVSGATTNYGMHLGELRSSSTFAVTRTIIDGNTDYGTYVVSTTNNTCEYAFTECSITGNGNGGSNEGGIHDARTQSAKVVATRCTFIGGSPYNAYDADNTQLMNAESCYWGAASGPGATINANVDGSPFLVADYTGWLIGGSPAGASKLEVRETATTRADHLHVIASRPYIVWEFASDFSGQTQTAYEIEVSSSSSFGSFMWDGSKTTSAATNVQYPATGGGVSALVDGTVYYLRTRFWNQDDVAGPWYYRTFRLNTAPSQVGDTDRSPTNASSTGDWTPNLVWERPVDADEDPMHFEVQLDQDAELDALDRYTIRSWEPRVYPKNPKVTA